MNQETYMDFRPTLGIIGDYFTKALKGSSFFCNIILGVHEHDIPSYNASGRALLEQLNLKLERDKQDSQKAAKLAGN